MGSDQCLVTSGLHEDHAGMFSGWELNVECGTTALIQHTIGQTRKRVGWLPHCKRNPRRLGKQSREFSPRL